MHNTDGSLCVTVRPDDIPFEGVKSFAVEEGTTNLVNPDLTTWTMSHGGTITMLPETYMGMPVYEFRCPVGTMMSVYQTFTHLINENFTGTIYYKKISGDRSFALYFRQAIFGTQYKNIALTNTEWTRAELNYQFTTDDTCMFLIYQPVATNTQEIIYHFAMPQLEKKPFATSFVDGTRADGRFIIPFNYDKFVIMATAKMTPGSLSTSSSLYKRIFGLYGGDGTSPTARFEVLNNPTLLSNYVHFANGTTQGVYFTRDFSITEYVNYIWTYDGFVSKVYINGILKLTMNVTIDFTPSKLFIGYLGYYSENYYLGNGLYSNIYIGNYDANIWTDAFIQELYNAKKPFSVPAKLPII
ncbi:hypothetical protein [Marinitoga hydrogenitolerans]|uniref:hypothetical protein n=1 Tax=Marinitoga hydrogenitolerans TaxID=287990 RepID=UPI0011607D64|nr:hypothetical protein [Marinitoga hydrogenitolerans]